MGSFEILNSIELYLGHPSSAQMVGCGLGGGCVLTILDEKSCREFETFQPHVAILPIGGNGVLPIVESDLIGHRLVAVATPLKRRFGLEHVYITQILPRFIRPHHKNER